MDDEHAFRQFIKNSIVNGYSQKETLKLLSFEFFYKGFFSLGSALEIIGQFEKDKDEVPSELHLILTILGDEYAKAKCSFEQQVCPCGDQYECSLKAITERYALDLEKGTGNEMFKIYLFDGIYGQKR
jgi:hypothetical protein